MKKKQQKTSKQKRVLVVSILLAALIVAGGTFAWFTSKDEVTNKLSASNEYGVTITETFTPPEQWTPGEDVEKKVGVVNTGNIDAFVRLQLKNTIDLSTVSTSSTLDKEKGVTLSEDEVKSLQAGGNVAYENDNDNVHIYIRNVEETTDDDGNTTYKYEYVGYCKVTDGGNDTYYAISNISKGTDNTYSYDYLVENSVSNNDLTLDYTKVSTDGYVVATYNAGTTDTTDDDIVIYINLADDWSNSWAYIDGYFYYNSILSSGNTSENLVKSVTLGDEVKEDAYYKFDYYLTVSLDSVQVTNDDNKNTAVDDAGWGATATVGANNSVTWSVDTGADGTD